MVDLGRLSGLTALTAPGSVDRVILLVFLGCTRVVSPHLGWVIAVKHSIVRRNLFDLERVDATSNFLANGGVETDDLGDVGSLELRSESALRTGGIPHAEQQRGRRVAEQVGGIAWRCIGNGLSDIRQAKQRSVQQAVSEDRVCQSMRSFEDGKLVVVRSPIVLGKVYIGDGESKFIAFPSFEQGQFCPVCLRCHGVQQNSYSRLVTFTDLALFNNIFVFCASINRI